jgi:hypothetical protein
MELETSGQSRLMCSLRLLRAKLRSDGSGSARKPTRPAAEVMPTVAMEAREIKLWADGSRGLMAMHSSGQADGMATDGQNAVAQGGDED